MTQHQSSLVEHALRQVAKVNQAGWEGIPDGLQASFVPYLCRDVWTSQSDLISVRKAALMIIRDAITRTGEFRSEE